MKAVRKFPILIGMVVHLVMTRPARERAHSTVSSTDSCKRLGYTGGLNKRYMSVPLSRWEFNQRKLYSETPRYFATT